MADKDNEVFEKGKSSIASANYYRHLLLSVKYLPLKKTDLQLRYIELNWSNTLPKVNAGVLKYHWVTAKNVKKVWKMEMRVQVTNESRYTFMLFSQIHAFERRRM